MSPWTCQHLARTELQIKLKQHQFFQIPQEVHTALTEPPSAQLCWDTQRWKWEELSTKLKCILVRKEEQEITTKGCDNHLGGCSKKSGGNVLFVVSVLYRHS